MKKILIYNDVGAIWVNSLAYELEDYFVSHNMDIDFVDANKIVNEDVLLDDNVHAFFMPGGAANPYKESLGDIGNNKIFEYVKKGGVYCGICAGAYYACRNTEFEVGIDGMEIKAQYGLNLIEGAAIGTMHKEFNISPYSFDYRSVCIPEIEWADKKHNKLAAYYHGGSYFKLESGVEQKVLATYKNVENNPPAIVARNIGKGLAIASGVHFEFNFNNLRDEIGEPYMPFDCVREIEKNELFRQALFMKVADMIKNHTRG